MRKSSNNLEKSTNLQPRKLIKLRNLQPRKIIKPQDLQPRKSSNPHEKTKPKNLKQINTHKEKQTQVKERVIWLVLFPTLLAAKQKKKKKIIISFNFVTLYQTRSMIHMPQPSNGAPMQWCWSRAIKAMHLSIYFKCYDVHDDMKRVPKEFMNLIKTRWVSR